jgi:hypothetical protein
MFWVKIKKVSKSSISFSNPLKTYKKCTKDLTTIEQKGKNAHSLTF